jgi:hypothetical protein
MTQLNQYRWPTKLKKLGITNPFLKIFVSKYENEIPWGSKINDSDSLKLYIKEIVFLKFMERIEFPPNNECKNHFYISSKDISLYTALESEANRNNRDIDVIRNLKSTQGVEVAKNALVHLINKRKYLAFKNWIEFLQKEYSDQHEFWLLLLRPLFESSGRGVRRSVIEPNLAVTEWLYLRLSRERLGPNDNMGHQYCLKLGLGSQAKIKDGWQFIAQGVPNSAKLTALCRGSGWCIAGMEYAGHYLDYCDFYILRCHSKPVVAILVERISQKIMECRGRFNEFPEDWKDDINVFLQIQVHLTRGYGCPSTSENFEDMPEIWWKERINLWPFSVLLAPDTIRNEFEMDMRLGAINCSHFENFTDLANRSGLVLDKEFWRTLIETDPSRYSDCSTTIKALPAIQDACVSGWLSMIEDDQITLNSIQSIPDFVKKHKVIQDAFQINLPSSFKKAVRVFPSSLHARENRFDIQSVLPAASEESKSLACERMVNTLLNNLDGVFSDEKFVDAVRQRTDYSCIREQAWTEAIQAQPPLWFALPPDLKSKQDFQLIDSDISRVDIAAWCTKITQKPWLLTQQNGVPKSIRLHKSILYAYREGWLPHLKKNPGASGYQQNLVVFTCLMVYLLMSKLFMH